LPLAVRSFLIWLWPAVSLMLLVISVGVLGASAGSEVIDRVVVTGAINVVLVVGLYVFIGMSGVFSFGHMVFMACGAYVGAVLTIPPVMKGALLPGLPAWLVDIELPPIQAVIVAAVVASLVGVIFASVLMRLAGLTASLATFALLIVVHVVLENWDAVTRGTAGMTGVPTSTTIAGALLGACVAIAIAYAFQESRTGILLRASREDDVAARSIGINVTKERMLAFAVSALIIGLGGALFAGSIGSFTPDAFYLTITFLTLAMLVVGGLRSLSGAVVGAVVVSVVAELLRRAEQGFDLGPLTVGAIPSLREVGLALCMLLILLLRPDGLTGGREWHWPLSRSQMRLGGAAPKPTAEVGEPRAP
jgi:branched-chain amino acid transport system permease protein